MSKHYILDGKDAVECDAMTWAKWYEKADRIIKKTDMGDACVSTVFLGLDHAFGEGPPMIFETLIFGGKHDQDMWRYSTWDEAESGHQKACELISC